MAGALGLKLAGPRVYGDTLVEDAFMGDGQARGGRRRHPACASALSDRVRDRDAGAGGGGAHRASLSIASRSRWAAQWSASSSSVRSTVAS